MFHSSKCFSHRRHTHSCAPSLPLPQTHPPCYFSDPPGKGTCFSRRTLHTNFNSIESQFRLFSCSHVVPSGLSWLDQPSHFTLNSNQQLLSFRASSRLPLSCPECTQQPFFCMPLNMTFCFKSCSPLFCPLLPFSLLYVHRFIC